MSIKDFIAKHLTGKKNVKQKPLFDAKIKNIYKLSKPKILMPWAQTERFMCV